VHGAPASAGSREGSDHFGSFVHSVSLHLIHIGFNITYCPLLYTAVKLENYIICSIFSGLLGIIY
jgi:hypothetical protein